MPSEFRPFDRPELVIDDSMILLDVSSFMKFEPVRPIYEKYFIITKYVESNQPKNKGGHILANTRFAILTSS
jgi:hypothetical protein